MSGVKGMTHRNKKFLMNKLREMYGEDFEPVVKMTGNAAFLQGIADEAQEDIADIDPSDVDLVKQARQNAMGLAKEANKEWDRVAKYVTPQLKAIENYFPEGVDVNVSDVSDLDLAKRVAFLLQKAIQEGD